MVCGLSTLAWQLNTTKVPIKTYPENFKIWLVINGYRDYVVYPIGYVLQ